MKLSNIARIALVKLIVIHNKACSLGPDAQVRIKLGLALQPAKQEDEKERPISNKPATSGSSCSSRTHQILGHKRLQSARKPHSRWKSRC